MKFGLLLASLLQAAQPAPPTRPASPLQVIDSGAMRMEITIGTGAQGDLSCAVTINGESEESELLCATLIDDEARRNFRGMPADVSLTADIVMALDGATIPPRSSLDRGDLIYESTARIGIDRTGRIGSCDMLGGHFSGQFAGMQGAVDPFPLCGMPELSSEAIFTAAPDGPASRAGVMRLDLYLRQGLSRRTA
jgi:hypothetical protein